MKLAQIVLLAALIPASACVGQGEEGSQVGTTEEDSIVYVPTNQVLGVNSVTPTAWTTGSAMWASSTSDSVQVIIRRGDTDPATGAQSNAHVFIFENGNHLLYCYKVAMSDYSTFLYYLNYYATYSSGTSAVNSKFWSIEGNVYIGRPPPPPPWPGGDQYLAPFVSHMQSIAQSHWNNAVIQSALITQPATVLAGPS